MLPQRDPTCRGGAAVGGLLPTDHVERWWERARVVLVATAGEREGRGGEMVAQWPEVGAYLPPREAATPSPAVNAGTRRLPNPARPRPGSARWRRRHGGGGQPAPPLFPTHLRGRPAARGCAPAAATGGAPPPLPAPASPLPHAPAHTHTRQWQRGHRRRTPSADGPTHLPQSPPGAGGRASLLHIPCAPTPPVPLHSAREPRDTSGGCAREGPAAATNSRSAWSQPSSSPRPPKLSSGGWDPLWGGPPGPRGRTPAGRSSARRRDANGSPRWAIRGRRGGVSKRKRGPPPPSWPPRLSPPPMGASVRTNNERGGGP